MHLETHDLAPRQAKIAKAQVVRIHSYPLASLVMRVGRLCGMARARALAPRRFRRACKAGSMMLSPSVSSWERSKMGSSGTTSGIGTKPVVPAHTSKSVNWLNWPNHWLNGTKSKVCRGSPVKLSAFLLPHTCQGRSLSALCSSQKQQVKACSRGMLFVH